MIHSKNFLKLILPSINSKNIFYFIGLVSFMIAYLSGETYWEILNDSKSLFIYTAIITLSFHLLNVLKHYTKVVEMFFLMSMFLLSLIVGIKIQNIFLVLNSYLLIFGAKKINFEDIVKVYFIVGIMFWTITVLGSFGGLVKSVKDDVGMRDVIFNTTKERWCCGYRWSTNMANHLFYILLAYFYIMRGILNRVEIIMYLFLVLFVLYMSDVKLSAACIILLLFASFYIKLKNRKKHGINKSPLLSILIYIIPFSFLFVYLATVFYDSGNDNWMMANIFLGGRLSISQDMLNKEGISIFGQYFKMYSSVRSDGSYYNYIDSSFLQLIIIYGLFYSFVIALGYIFICKRAVLNGDIVLLLSVSVGAVSGIVCQHFIQLYMNPFFLALFALHSMKKKEGILGDNLKS